MKAGFKFGGGGGGGGGTIRGMYCYTLQGGLGGLPPGKCSDPLRLILRVKITIKTDVHLH